MEIREVKSVAANSVQTAQTSAVKPKETQTEASEQETAAAATKRQDTYVKSKQTDPTTTGIYSKESISQNLDDASQIRTKAFLSMVDQLFQKQGKNTSNSLKDIANAIKEKFSPEDIAGAQASIEDGGDYSVDAVATRIMDCAMALAGDDPSKISTLREAVTKGFGQAASQLGLKEDDMPDITKSTYTEIMKRFDDWESSYKTEDSQA